jgi:hypothetical protein
VRRRDSQARSDVLIGGDGNDRLDAREGASASGNAAQAGSVDHVTCGGGNDTALVDPNDVVDPGCENVIGGASNPPAQNPPAQNPPAQNPPAQGPPVQNPPAQNHAPTGITLVPASVDENEPVDTEVGTLSAQARWCWSSTGGSRGRRRAVVARVLEEGAGEPGRGRGVVVLCSRSETRRACDGCQTPVGGRATRGGSRGRGVGLRGG